MRSARSGRIAGPVLPAFCLLQLLLHSPDLARHARHGIGPYGSRVGPKGTAGIDASTALALG